MQTHNLRPTLQFDDVFFGIFQIHELYCTRTRNFCRNDLANHSTTCCQHSVSGGFDVVHRKSDVRKTRAVDCRFRPFCQVAVLKDLESRSIIAITWKSQVYAVNLGTGNPCAFFQSTARQLSFRRYRRASENLFVELSQPLPVPSDQIGVNIPRADSHIYLKF